MIDYSTDLNTFTSQKVFNYGTDCQFYHELKSHYEWNITLDGFYDDEYSGWRWSINISYPGGTMMCGGYGDNNEILFKTYKDALEYAIEIICGNRSDGKELRRDMKLKLILEL